MKIISKEAAKKQGLKRYYTGKPCPNGHIAERFVTGKCVECNRERNKLRPKKGAAAPGKAKKVKISAAVRQSADEVVATAMAMRDALLEPVNKDRRYYVAKIVAGVQTTVGGFIEIGATLIEAKAMRPPYALALCL